MAKRIVVDLDGTLTIDAPGISYTDKIPNIRTVARLREYKEAGFTIAIFTARNMRTYAGNIGMINANTLPVIVDWLGKHGVPYDEIHVGKPWCGEDGFYVDDKAVRPSEFARMSFEEIRAFLDAEHDVEGAGETSE